MSRRGTIEAMKHALRLIAAFPLLSIIPLMSEWREHVVEFEIKNPF